MIEFYHINNLKKDIAFPAGLLTKK